MKRQRNSDGSDSSQGGPSEINDDMMSTEYDGKSTKTDGDFTPRIIDGAPVNRNQGMCPISEDCNLPCFLVLKGHWI